MPSNVLVSGLIDSENFPQNSSYNGLYVYDGAINDRPTYIKQTNGVTTARILWALFEPDPAWLISKVSITADFVATSSLSDVPFPWLATGWQTSGINPDGLVITEVPLDSITIRNNKYATDTESGAERFRRLLSLGYV